MAGLNFYKIHDVMDRYDAFFFDIWGVIIENDMLYPGVVENINKISRQKQVRFLSNIPRPQDFTHRLLSDFGIKTSKEHVITSGSMVRDVISDGDRKNVKIFHLGQHKNKEVLGDMDVELVSDIKDADIFLMSLFTDDESELNLHDDTLKKAAELGVRAVCANPDTTIQHRFGVRYCAGYFAAKFEKFGGKTEYVGKPRPEIFERTISAVPGIDRSRILMIGDSFHTDILGANAAGIDSGLVLTGNAVTFHSKFSDMQDKITALAARSQVEKAKPTMILDIAEQG